MPADAVEVGRVMGAWGIKGGIKVKPFAADPQALFSSRRWFVQPPEVAGPRGPKLAALPTVLKVLGAKEHGDGVVATAQELPDRNAAEALRGARIFVSRASFPTPDDGEFYWVDLIGLAVANRQQVTLGGVVGLIETGPHCVLRIQPANTATPEVLIPFVDAYVDSVDLAARRIVVDWEADDDTA
ncbi:MAG: ribosome maturation factor RimM [Rubrivivax sp.]|nr:ribosome maturation factor RimM [Rubrivivax sp.]